jgi:hypothetical protein
MRISLAISLLILAAAALSGWRDSAELSSLRAEREKLAAQAAALGVSTDVSRVGEKQARHTRHERGDKTEEARRAGAEILAILAEMERHKESGLPHDAALQDRILGGLELLRSLDGDQLLTLIADFRDAPGISEASRRLFLAVAMETLTQRDPRAALDLIAADGDAEVTAHNRVGFAKKALSEWAAADPSGALAWLRANPMDFMRNQSAELSLIEGAARTSPLAAVGMISGLGLEDKGAALTRIASQLDNPQQRTEMLAVLRDGSAGWDERDVRQALSTMFYQVAKDGFESGVRWVEENKLTEKEIDSVSHQLMDGSLGAEKGEWIGWMAGKLPEDARDMRVQAAVGLWTEKDHRAAGEWLAALPDGPVKIPAVAAFAQKVAPYDPQVAAQWALTLPPGPQRKTTLRIIYGKWPQEDAAARAAFMAKHPAE